MHLDIEVERLETAVAVDQLKIDDVGMLGTKNARHRPERARDVAQYDGESRCATVRALSPRQVEPVGIDPARERVATDDVNFDLFVLAAKPDDAITRDRVAALREMIGDAR